MNFIQTYKIETDLVNNVDQKDIVNKSNNQTENTQTENECNIKTDLLHVLKDEEGEVDYYVHDLLEMVKSGMIYTDNITSDGIENLYDMLNTKRDKKKIDFTE